MLLALFGGTALLLYGIRLSGDSLQRAVGGRLRQLLTGLSRKRVVAVASGATVTAIIQSSAATTLMLIGFVSAGIMTFRQTLGIILGADIGTTLTVQLIAFRITDCALLIVGVGFVITFVARRASAQATSARRCSASGSCSSASSSSSTAWRRCARTSSALDAAGGDDRRRRSSRSWRRRSSARW